MIIIQKKIDLPDTYPLERLGTIEDLLFFDIETTGFSGDYSSLYLIGCTYYKDGTWNLIQWFADTVDSEEALLHEFFHFMSSYSILIHFNGDGFDLPYLLKRCKHYGLSYDFSYVQSFDIYKKIKPYKQLLQLENVKQKTIEQFLGIQRKDLYSGGQLIEVYHDYLVTHDTYLYDMLILHNEDDLKGMPLILPILNYPDFLEHDFELTDYSVLKKTDIFGDSHPELQLLCKSSYSIPVSIEYNQTMISFLAQGDQLIITLPLYEGELKHFYSDYKDYYYLIYEDSAVHKSVGQYVDKQAKKKATAKTCYTRKTGTFLPQFSPVLKPFLMREYKDKITYVEFDDNLLKDPQHCRTYLDQLLTYLWGAKRSAR